MINALSIQCISDRLPEIVGRALYEPDDHYVKPFVLRTGMCGPVLLVGIPTLIYSAHFRREMGFCVVAN